MNIRLRKSKKFLSESTRGYRKFIQKIIEKISKWSVVNFYECHNLIFYFLINENNLLGQTPYHARFTAILASY